MVAPIVRGPSASPSPAVVAPHDLAAARVAAAERQLVGALLIDAATVSPLLDVRDLADPRIAAIARAALVIVARGQEPVPIAIAAELDGQHGVDVGAVLDVLTEAHTLGGVAGAPVAAEVVRDDAERRRIIDAARRVQVANEDGADVGTMRGLLAAVTSPAPVRATEWPDMGIDDVLAAPAVEWLADELVPLAGVCVLAGHPRTGKTFVAIDLACRIAHGMPTWLGAAIGGHGPVAYLALEGHGGLAGRIRAWRKHHAAERQVHPLRIITPDDDAPLLSADGVATTRDRLRRWAARHGKPVLVVVDTATLAMDGDENDSSTWRAALRVAAQIAREHGCAVLLVHHLRKDSAAKPEPLSLASLRGSGAVAGNVDQVLGVEQRGDDGYQLATLKSKDGPEALPRGYALDVVRTGIERRNGKAETSCVVRPTGAVVAPVADPVRDAADAVSAQTTLARQLVDALRGLGGSTRSKETLYARVPGKTDRKRGAMGFALSSGMIIEQGRPGAAVYVLPSESDPSERVVCAPHTPRGGAGRPSPDGRGAAPGEGAARGGEGRRGDA